MEKINEINYQSHLYESFNSFSKEFIEDSDLDNQSVLPVESSNKLIKDNGLFSTKDSFDKQDEISDGEIFFIKTKNSKTKIVKHDKYFNDNITKKMKTMIVRMIIYLLNDMIKTIHGKDKGKLFLINPKETEDSTIEFNRQYINKTIKEILSVAISSKYTTKDKLNNIKVIEKLLNADDKNIRKRFEKILYYKFKDVAKYLGGEEKDDQVELAGLKSTHIWKKFLLEKEEKYIKRMKDFMINLEQILNDLRPRKKQLNKIKEI